jgi:dienelactone hydrolase
MIRYLCGLAGLSFLAAVLPVSAYAQAYGEPDRSAPGDAMIQAYLAAQAVRIDSQFDDDLKSLEHLQQQLPRFRQEYLEMLGLWPLPERTPLEPTITGTIDGDGFTVELLHYQSVPGLYVTANLYRPLEVEKEERLPAVLYVCGHSQRGRDGNKTAYQSHGIWLARHGYVCLVLDTLQLGEIAAIHHGTYREQRWWWHSRGYTSAGVECWNGMRAIDYLVSRDDVDPARIGVTGISGGGAATFWIAAADERVAVAVPVSGMADLESYVANRVINGHCDCMFLHNSYAWPWTRIATLIAPRPLLFVNSDADAIFPMDANERISNRLERLYSLSGAGDQVDAVVSIGGHAYRKDIRQAAFRFLNTHLKHDPREISDSEHDLVNNGRVAQHPIEPERLRVFRTDADIPADQLNTMIDEHFVPTAQWELPTSDRFADWQSQRINALRRGPFRSLPPDIPAAATHSRQRQQELVETEPGIVLMLQHRDRDEAVPGKRIVLVVRQEDELDADLDWLSQEISEVDAVSICDVRGVGETRWARRNPPNYVERSHVLLGQTVDTARVRDVVAIAKYLSNRSADAGDRLPVHVIGKGSAASWAAYAALLAPEPIASVTMIDPPATHGIAQAPQFLGMMRIGDASELLGLLAPRPLKLVGANAEDFAATVAAYEAAGAAVEFSH